MRKLFPLQIEKHARHFPDRIAIADWDNRVTFHELQRCLEIGARYLVSCGITRESRVVVLAEKTASSVAAILAVLRCGATYVPIDPSTPVGRLSYMLDDINPDAVIVDTDRTALHVRGSMPTVRVFSTGDLATAGNVSWPLDPAMGPTPDNIAYIMYTSGSTGRPKGVQITYDNVQSFFDAVNTLMCIDSKSVCMNTSPLYFDVFLMDTFLPLCMGSTVHLTTGLPMPHYALNIIEKERVTHITGIAPVMGLLVADDSLLAAHDLTSLQVIDTGGDVCDKEVFHRLLRHAPYARIINGYGTTETTVSSTGYVVRFPELSRNDFYPIGKPLPGVRVVVVDASGQEVNEPGKQGELWIGGRQVMTGYWNKSDETAKVIESRDGVRFYKTGDICRWDVNRDLNFVGREDHQVKLSGYRIHLNEIRRALLAQSGVMGCVVGAIDRDNGHKTLAAFIETDHDPRSNIGPRIVEGLKHELPTYMIPTHLFLTRILDRTPTGKIDISSALNRARVAIQRQPAQFYLLTDSNIEVLGKRLAY